MPETLHKIRIKKVLGPINAGTAVLLGNEDKTFVMFIGTYEGAAILREINDEKPPRPMTHDLLDFVLTGFEIEIEKVVISSIVDNTFCATLVLKQRCKDGEEWSGRRNEVHIDARPSDCLVLALKRNVDIYATDDVLEKVHDISDGLQLQGGTPSAPAVPFGLKELDLSGLGGEDSGFPFGGEGEGEDDSDADADSDSD
ncbi:MAG: bifunctional nuclease family protein [Planctomycetota bacterium]